MTFWHDNDAVRELARHVSHERCNECAQALIWSALAHVTGAAEEEPALCVTGDNLWRDAVSIAEDVVGEVRP